LTLSSSSGLNRLIKDLPADWARLFKRQLWPAQALANF